MSSGSLDRLARVFADAQQQPPDQRQAFVIDACGADPDLCAQVLSLLQASDDADQFLAAPALDALAREVAADGWSLRTGDRVGVYSVTELLGAGGSGEVWRARDDRLGRDVALKVLLPHLVRDPGLTRRFAEEARAAGALNHPNVLTVYDVGEHHGAPFIVSEYLEGESLRRRLRTGALSPADTLSISAHVAAGLAAAHSRGLVHRDLKPDNIFLTSDGGVKILDFGLAKLYTPAEGALAVDRLTLTGVIVGTAGYMAPEQARGQAVDPRTDLFALGATMYEMLAGRRAFAGANTVEALHAILSTDPPALLDGKRQVPQTLVRLVERLLAKAPADRFQSAFEVREALERCAHEPGGARHELFAFRRLSWPARIALLAVAAALVGGGWWIRGRPLPDEAVPAAQFAWTLPGQLGLDSAPVISPDGQWLVFVGVDASTRRIYLRPLRSLESRPLAGTDGAQQPFWSPDSGAIGFFARGKIFTVGVVAGIARSLADAPEPHGGSWGSAGTIVFAPGGAGAPLLAVPAGGGPLRKVTEVDPAVGQSAHLWPVFLPDGTHFAYFSDGADRGMRLGRIDRSPSGSDPLLMASETAATYVSRPGGRGFLLSAAGNSIAVAHLDPAFQLIDGFKMLPIAVGGSTTASGARLSASETALAFAAVSPPGVRFGSVNRDGTELSLREEREVQDRPRVSPDGRLLARQRADPRSGRIGIWVEDLATGAQRQVSGADQATHPVWSPDGRRLAYASGSREAPHLALVAADGGGAVVTLRCPGAYCEPTDWSPKGEQLIVNVRGVGGADVWAVWTHAEGAARPLLAGPSIERDARLSPDGRWVAFVTEQAGSPQVGVRRTTGSAPAATMISPGGGDRPIWRRDGRELFFVDGQNRLQVATISPGPGDTLTFGAPVAQAIPPFGGTGPASAYDVSPDGRRIYFLRRAASALPRELRMVIGWQRLLR